MTPERWQRIQDVLAAAIECESGARHHLIAERCAGDADLRHEVETLLTAHESAGPIDRLADAIVPAASWARAQAVGWEGCRVGHYLVGDLLGAGGMGLVYKAHDERLGRDVALKFLLPGLSTQSVAKQRFLVEARAAAALDHPNVCTIHEIGETGDGHLFIAMPLYDGETLQARLTRGRLAFADAGQIAVQMARGLALAHEHGIVHRDVKPSNVMLLADGTVKILDFGIAKKIDDLSSTGYGVPVGTIAYMSPEHVRGSAVDRRADIWSLGVLLHEMLTGARPFDGDDRQAVAHAILTKEPELIATPYPDVPAGVDDLLRRALAKPPEHRYPSMVPFASDLAALLSPGESRGATASDQEALPVSERRRAAVLVTLVSNYPTLVEHLAPADAHRLVARIRDAAVDVVRRHGGLVNQAIGEEIVSLFGVPAAHEDDELRAVRAALELHARVADLSPGAGGDDVVRVQSGLHVGPVVAQRLQEGPRRYAIVGAPAHVASRLAGIAGPGGIVLSPDCQRLVAPFVQTDACPAVVLEPDGRPISPFRVTGETGLETRLEVSERAGLTPYVGRQSELALLDSQVERARAGDGRVIAVVGDAGAGKSRLLHELRERVAASAGVRLLQGRCRAYGDVAPYGPFIEILRDALDLRTAAIRDWRDVVAPIRAIDASLERFLPLYLHLLSAPSDSHPFPRHLQGEHLQAALLDAVAAMIAGLAGRATLVVLLEDWHWADAASRAALDRVTEIVAAHPLLCVVTSRPERGAVDGWPARGTRIQLEPLDFAASTAIMQAVLRVERVSEELARRVFERTGGNPFFLEQMCSALIEQGAVSARGGEAVVGGGTATLSLPDTVQAVIRTRLDKLEPNAREVLRVAAVIGREFHHTLLEAALGRDADPTAAIGRLKAIGLIQQTSVARDVAYRFTHVLTQEVSYESLLGYQRKSLHEVIGGAIESQHARQIDDKAALLARHFECAGAWPKAVRYGRRAAERASALSQFADALAMLDRVLSWLDHLPDDDARHELKADLLLQQERECETLGLRGRQREIIGALIAHLAPRGQSSRLAEAYLRQGDLLTLLKRFDAADRALSTALRISHERDDAALERNTLRSVGLLRWHEGRFAEALTITENALSIDRECGDQLAVAGDLTNLGNILKSMGDYAAALPRLEEALAMPSLAEDPKKLAFVLHNLANVHRARGDLAAALTCLRRADESARVHLLPIQRSFHLTSIAHIHLQQGRVDSALQTYQEAVALSRRARHAEGLAQSLRTLGEVLFGLRTGDDALPYLQEAAQLFAQLEDPISEAEMWNRAATILERARRPAEAADAWGRLRSLCQQLDDNRGKLDALEGIARATRQSESPAASIAAFEAALDLASTLGDGRRALALHNTLGILEWARGGYVEALRHYERALLLVRAQGDDRQAGLILNSLGVTLTKLHRPEEARTALEESLALSRQTGERLLEAHALAALGQMSRNVGRVDRAVEYFEQSLEHRRALGDRAGEGWMLRRLAETRAALGDDAAARHAAAAAARIAIETGDADLIGACTATATH
jgi:tetratricopeptide (TPR) repeat protein/class 3 adenylate cyclase